MPPSVVFSPPATPNVEAALQQALVLFQAVIQTKPDSDRLLAEMVRICGQALRAGGAGVWVIETTTGIDKPQLILEHNLPSLQILVEGVPAKGAIAAVRRCAREGKPLIVPPHFSEETAAPTASAATAGIDPVANPSPLELLFVPMKIQNRVGMVLLMAVPQMTAAPNNPDGGGGTWLHRTYLNFLARMVSAVEQSLTQRHLTLIEKDRGRSNKLMRFSEQVHKHLFLGPVAADISNLARDVLEADRVTVELYPRLKKKVVAVSNVDEPNKRATTMQVQRLIFDYVRDRQVPVVIDRDAAKQLVSDPALQDAASAYFMACDFHAFVAAPVKSDEPTSPVLGVIFAEYATSDRAQAASTLMAEVSRLATGAVANAMDMESLPLIKTFYAVRAIWRKPTSSKRAMLTTVATLIAVTAILLCAIPFDFAIKADCQIRPRAQLSIVAPLQERIINVPVRAGEHVYPRAMKEKLGDAVKPLAEFDTIELVSKRAEAMGRLAQYQVEKKQNESKGDMSKISASQNQIEQTQAEIAQIEHQIDQCTVWSPIEGTVLTENVEQKQYSTPRQGEELMDVASFSDWELVVDVPEAEVAAVRAALDKQTHRAAIDGRADSGIEVEYILYPWPDTRYSIRARGTGTLLPAAQQSKNANVFRLQVKLDAGSLPPGIAMSGVTGRAKVHIGHEPLIQQWTHGAVRLLKMTMLF